MVARWLSRVLLLGMAGCAVVVCWTAAAAYRGRQCLDGDLHEGLRLRSVGVTGRGCEAVTESGETVVRALGGPSFGVGLVAVGGLVVLGVALAVVVILSRRRAGRRVPAPWLIALWGGIAYLAAGAVFAWAGMPPQLWSCPDATAPHGYVTYGGVSEPPRPDCWPNVTLGEQVIWFVFAVPTWLPLVVLKGVSNAMGA